MKYQAILFDMDGIIVNSEPLQKLALKKTFEEYGVGLTDADFTTYFVGKTYERGLKDYLAHSAEQIDVPEFIDKKVAVYGKLSAGKISSYPGVVELVRELSNQVPLALVTGSLRFEAELALKTLEIDDCFDIIVSADDIDKSKPNPEGYLKAAVLLTKAPENCVVVEDSPAGVAAANEAEMHCIAVTNTHTESELANADLVVAQLSRELF